MTPVSYTPLDVYKRQTLEDPDFNTGAKTLLVLCEDGEVEYEQQNFAGGNVDVDTSKLERYFVFNDFEADDLDVGVREGVEEDTNKRNRNDFVLWFTKSKFEDLSRIHI